MKLGFTGTQDGLTEAQRDALARELRQLDHVTITELLNGSPRHLIEEAHHGDCIGADATFDAFCAEMDIPRTAHPGTDVNGRSPKRAWCDVEYEMGPKPYLQRNCTIVLSVDHLIACPRSDHEETRSGTWYTVRQARRFKRPVTIIYPDGRVEREAP